MFGNDWDNVLKNIYDGEYFRPLLLKVQNEYKNKVIAEEEELLDSIEKQLEGFRFILNNLNYKE